jgi:hypothetical protein
MLYSGSLSDYGPPRSHPRGLHTLVRLRGAFTSRRSRDEPEQTRSGSINRLPHRPARFED